jgi:hypothetical protein
MKIKYKYLLMYILVFIFTLKVAVLPKVNNFKSINSEIDKTMSMIQIKKFKLVNRKNSQKKIKKVFCMPNEKMQATLKVSSSNINVLIDYIEIQNALELVSEQLSSLDEPLNLLSVKTDKNHKKIRLCFKK